MKLSRLIGEVGPQLVTQWLNAQPWVTEESKEQTRAMLLDGINGVADSLQHTELQSDQRGRAKFITELAVHVMHSSSGTGTDAVRLVATMLEQAEKLCSK